MLSFILIYWEFYFPKSYYRAYHGWSLSEVERETHFARPEFDLKDWGGRIIISNDLELIGAMWISKIDPMKVNTSDANLKAQIYKLVGECNHLI